MKKKVFMIIFMCLGLISMNSIFHHFVDTIYGYTPVFQLSRGDKVVIGEYKGRELIWDVGKSDSNQTILMSTTG